MNTSRRWIGIGVGLHVLAWVSAAPHAASLVARWEFDGHYGTSSHDSAYDLIPGGGVLLVPSPRGMAARFHGGTYTMTDPATFSHPALDRLDTSAALGNAQFNGGLSIMGWIKPNVSSLADILAHDCSSRAGSYTGFQLGVSSSVILYLRDPSGDGQYAQADGTPVTPARWVHVAATWNGSLTDGFALYINGSPVPHRVVSWGRFRGLDGASPFPLRIGANLGDSLQQLTAFDGLIDRLVLYAGVLSAAEVEADYTATIADDIAPPEPTTWEGTDDFSSGFSAAKWQTFQRYAGQMTVAGTNGHASFLVPLSAASEQNAFIVWRGNPTAAEDWTAEILGHNTAFHPSCQLQFAAINTEAWRTGAVHGFVAGMVNKTQESLVGTSWWHYPEGWTSRVRTTTTSTLFRLRLVYHATTQTIEAWHDPTATGQSWTKLDSMTVSEMSPGMTTTNTFSLAILGNTDYGPIPEGELWADDFRLSAPGTPTPPSPLGLAREWHTATLLADGRVLVAGGYTGGFPNGTYPAAAELYDPATGNWTATGALANPRGRHTATPMSKGKVLVVGGAGAGGMLKTTERYDPVTGTWTLGATMGTPRATHSATWLPSGQILVAGGTGDGVNALASAELYDPGSGTWTAVGSMHTARCYPGAVLLCDGRVLVAGGAADARGNGSLASCEIYDPTTRTWAPTGPMATDRQVHSVTVLPGGRVLAVGGEDRMETRLANAELYDPARGTWTPAEPLAFARKWHTANLLPSGQVLVVGGTGNNGYPAEVERYDPATGKWTAGSRLTTPRYWHTGTLLTSGDVLIAGGGAGDNPAYASIELVDSPPGVATPVALGDVALLPGGWFRFRFHNTPGLGFRVLSTTDLGAPAGHWTFRGAPTERCPGWYEFSTSQDAIETRQFYRVVTVGP